MDAEEYKKKVMSIMLEYRKQYNPVDDWKILDALDWLYEEIRNIPTK